MVGTDGWMREQRNAFAGFASGPVVVAEQGTGTHLLHHPNPLNN